MEKGIRSISFNIYANDDAEAEKGRIAIIQFINIMGLARLDRLKDYKKILTYILLCWLGGRLSATFLLPKHQVFKSITCICK